MNPRYDPENNTYVLNFLEAQGYEILPRSKLGAKRRACCGGLEGEGSRMTKGMRIWDLFQSWGPSPPPRPWYIRPVSTPIPVSSHFRSAYGHKEKNQAYGSALLDISTVLAGLVWKIPFHLLQLHDLKLSFPIKYASTDFYEHRQKLLQPFFFPPKSFKPTVVAM